MANHCFIIVTWFTNCSKDICLSCALFKHKFAHSHTLEPTQITITRSHRRNYDMYLGKQQFASISGTFLAWEFELKDAQGGTLALIDRNFQVRLDVV